jgi:ketosteroid isomerase-like protein
VSKKNAKLVRKSVRRFAAGDLTGLASLYAPDIAIVAPPGWPDGERYEGRDAVIRALARAQEDWASQGMEIQKERAGGDWVVLEILWTVEGAGSGTPTQVTVIAAARVAGMLIGEILYFWDWNDALEAAGLEE